MPKPAIDEFKIFSEEKKQELKRKSPRGKGNSNEVEQIKEIYQVLFPAETIPDLLCEFYTKLRDCTLTDRSDVPIVMDSVEDDVKEGGHRPILEPQAELVKAVTQILLEIVPNDPRFAALASSLQAFKKSARESSIINEAANLVTDRQKRRRASNDQPHIVCDESHLVARNPTKIADHATTSLVTTTAKRARLPQSSANTSSYLSVLDNTSTKPWSPEPCEVLDTTTFSTFDASTTEQGEFNPDVYMDPFSEEWSLVNPNWTVVPSHGQTEANGVHAEVLEFTYRE
jgi:hypothetical protein